MSALAHEDYKFKKGDKLEDIAKKHGLKDANSIWKFPENKAIASKRGKPEQLQPGDVLVLPPSEKDLKEAHGKAAKALASIDAELGRTKQKLAAIDKLINESNASYLAIIKELGANKARVESAGDTADAVAMIASTGASLAKITAKGATAAKLTEKELEELNKELLSEARSMATDPIQTGTAKIMASCAATTNPAMLFVKTLGQSWDEMTSPSFWANTATQLLSGKSWSEAVTTKVTDEIDDQVRTIQAQRNDQLKMLISHRKNIEGLSAKLQSERKVVEASMKELH